MPKLMLIDGNSLVNRAYYGVRPLSAPDGTPTNAVFGFLNILQRLLDDEKPDALCVMFDRREPTFRHKHSEAYKATRKPMPDDLAAQMPVLKDVLDALGIERRELSGWEADDLLGTVSRIGAEQGWECVVVTGDKDALQLVGEHVRVLNVKTRMGQTETVNYTPERFREEYGFDAPHMVDLKALMGDTSDNIPASPAWGRRRRSSLCGSTARSRACTSISAIPTSAPRCAQSSKTAKRAPRIRTISPRSTARLPSIFPPTSFAARQTTAARHMKFSGVSASRSSLKSGA